VVFHKKHSRGAADLIENQIGVNGFFVENHLTTLKRTSTNPNQPAK